MSSAMQTACHARGLPTNVRAAGTQRPFSILAAVCPSVQLATTQKDEYVQPASHPVPPVPAGGTASPVAPSCPCSALIAASAWLSVLLVPTGTTTRTVAAVTSPAQSAAGRASRSVCRVRTRLPCSKKGNVFLTVAPVSTVKKAFATPAIRPVPPVSLTTPSA